LNNHDPANVCANYLADSGLSTSSGSPNSRTYSFQVAANATFVVVVGQANISGLCDYTLDVTGGSCRPFLNISQTAPSTVTLDWTTAAVGYQLEHTNTLQTPGAPSWVPTLPNPSVIDSRFVVTNNSSGDTTRFYRLRKP
jgi:hypothetical protein